MDANAFYLGLGALALVAAGLGLALYRVDRARRRRIDLLEERIETLADRVSPRILHHPARLDDAARELDEYFDGRRRAFSLNLDWRLSAGFRETVLRHLSDIAYGHTASYATVAELAGRPKAVRAVGTACATNPLPVIVPCHRVIRSDGSMGGYLGGLDAKATLLAVAPDIDAENATRRP